MATRDIQIIADSADLEILSRSVNSPECTIAKGTNGWVLRAQELNAFTSDERVRERANEILTTISGAAKVLIGSSVSLEAGSIVEHAQGKPVHTILHVHPAVVRSRVFPVSLVVTHPDGSVEEHHPADRAAAWTKAAISNDAIAKVLRLRNQGDLDWVALYRVFEVVDHDIGVEEMVRLGWVAATDVRLFKHTANSVAAAGDMARHGKETTAPPKTPMPLKVARELIDDLSAAWLDHRS